MLFQFFYVLLAVSLHLFVKFVKCKMEFEYFKSHKNVNFSNVCI